METALYFPYIRVPENPWFTQVLLYWDSAASIIPTGRNGGPIELGRYMTELMEAKLVRKVSPLPVQLDRSFHHRFFLLLDAANPPKLSDTRRHARIHEGKTDPFMFADIAIRGLARKVDGEHKWWEVEEWTAALYMACLVGEICRRDSDLVPVSDKNDELLKLTQSAEDTRSRLNGFLSIIIRDVLPVPSQVIRAHELAAFKSDHEEQLRRLQTHLKFQLADLAIIDDAYIREVKINGIKQEIEDDVRLLSERMSNRNWPTTLAGIAALISPMLGMAGAVVTGGTGLALGLGIGSAGAAVASTGLAFRPTRQSYDCSPLAYAALAGRLTPEAGRHAG
jgi:hypothetical protein